MGKTSSSQDNTIIQKLDLILKNLEIAIKQKKADTPTTSVKKKWYKRFPYIQGLGLLILFVSWISENIYQNYWQNKKSEFDFKFSVLVQTQQTVLSQEIAAKQFLALNLLAKDTNNIIKANTLRYLSLFCQDYITLKKMSYSILNLDKELLSDNDYSSYWTMLNGDSLIINRYFQNKNIDSLNYHANIYLSEKEGAKVNSEIDLLRKYSYKIGNRLNRFNLIFILFYIVGSIFIGFDYVKKQLK